jgi:hypothetical protein
MQSIRGAKSAGGLNRWARTPVEKKAEVIGGPFVQGLSLCGNVMAKERWCGLVSLISLSEFVRKAGACLGFAGIAWGVAALVLGCQPGTETVSDDSNVLELRGERLFVRGALHAEPIQTTGSEAAVEAATSDAETHGTAPRCPAGMQLVEGKFCPFMGHRCAKWLNEKQDRCQRYAPPPICEGREQSLSVCVDQYEYPNQAGVYPAVMVSFVEAQAACGQENKRLCTESEWTLACEGNERLPYPYGYERDPAACNIDRPYGFPDLAAFDDERKVGAEVARLDQRVQSGSMPRCKSPFGVYDMTGNVDEWVVNETRLPDSGTDISGLKGGYFGPIRARCRPMTTSHNRWFRFYQVGFRCCSGALHQPSSGEISSVASK